MPEKIISELLNSGQVLRLTLNAPKGNILSAQMMTDIQTELENIDPRSQIKLLQFTGSGDHFSFGASVPEHKREEAPDMLKRFHLLFYTLMDLSIPTAALISGQCLGGAMELALMCNFLFLDKSARLGQPEINLGVFAPPASLILPLKIGQTQADDLLLTGRTIDSETVNNLGLATKVFDDHQLMLSGVNDWICKYILPKSASSLKYAVRAARTHFNMALRDELDHLERNYTEELMNSHDANEGINAFLEKRPPKWESK
ncbi:MAG: enoyl-CoA hydratase-related protein [Candidatus Neomarinimicrobiota bacterium]